MRSPVRRRPTSIDQRIVVAEWPLLVDAVTRYFAVAIASHGSQSIVLKAC